MAPPPFIHSIIQSLSFACLLSFLFCSRVPEKRKAEIKRSVSCSKQGFALFSIIATGIFEIIMNAPAEPGSIQCSLAL